MSVRTLEAGQRKSSLEMPVRTLEAMHPLRSERPDPKSSPENSSQLFPGLIYGTDRLRYAIPPEPSLHPRPRPQIL